METCAIIGGSRDRVSGMTECLEQAVTEDLRLSFFIPLEFLSVLDEALKALNLVACHNG